METDLQPIRSEPVSVVIVNAEPLAIELGPWLSFIDAAPWGSQLVIVADVDVPAPPKHPRLRFIRHVQPLGFGACVQTAVWSIETPLVFFVPGDSSLSIDETREFFERIDGAHLVVGARGAGEAPFAVRVGDVAKAVAARVLLGYVPGPRIAWPGRSGWRLRRVARHGFGVPQLDPGSGVLLMRREVFAQLPIQSRGEFVWVEILAKASHLGCLVDEIGIRLKPAVGAPFARDAWRLFRAPDFGAAPSSASASRKIPQ